MEESIQGKNAKLPQEAARERETSKSPGRKISELLKEKEREWTEVVRKAGPLQLLDLPLDLLSEILREVRGSVPVEARAMVIQELKFVFHC